MAGCSTLPTMRPACSMGRPRPQLCCSALSPPSGTRSSATPFPLSTRKSCRRSSHHTRQNAPVTTTRQMGAAKVDIDFAPGPAAARTAERISGGWGRAAERPRDLYQNASPGHDRAGRSTLCHARGRRRFSPACAELATPAWPSLAPAGTSRPAPVIICCSRSRRLLPRRRRKGSKGAPTPQPAAQLQSAVQLGNVTLVQQPAAKPGGQTPPATTATADRASYDAATQVVQLTGNPRVHDAGGDLTALSMEIDRATGNANATGGVKATYRQASGQQNVTFTGTGPVHVVADHAHLDHQADLTTFYGTPQSQARMFQGSDSVSAPVLELSQSHATLAAHGPPGDATAVNAVFTSSSSNAKSPTLRGPSAEPHPSLCRQRAQGCF